MAADLASEDYQALLIAKGGPSWRNLVDASATAATWLGISQHVWGEACQMMGRERAAICVLVIDRNWRLPEGHRYRANSPRHCLIGMAKQVRGNGFKTDRPCTCRSNATGEMSAKSNSTIRSLRV